MTTLHRILAGGALGLIGCTTSTRILDPTSERARPTETPAAAAAQPEPRFGVSPRVVVERVEGRDESRARTVLAPVREPMRECEPGTTGAVQVRIQSDERSTRVDWAPGSGLDAASRRCVLAVVSSLDLEELATRGSPSDRASGFSVLLRVEW